MNGKVNKRVDGLLHLLLKYETNTFFNRQTKELMWKYNRKEAREKERHQLGSLIADKDFKVIFRGYAVAIIHLHTQLYTPWISYSHRNNPMFWVQEMML